MGYSGTRFVNLTFIRINTAFLHTHKKEISINLPNGTVKAALS